MVTRARYYIVALVALALAGCTLPGAASPTPFTFPTPNLTLTAIFAPTATETPLPPTLPPIGPSPTLAATTPPGTPPPTATSGIATSRPNGSPVTATFLSSAPVIDGDLSEWTGTGYKADQIVYGAASWSGSSDLSATYYLGWDGGNLYLAVRVTDDKFVQISTGSQIFKGDAVELQFDADLAGDFSSAYLSSDDFQIGLSPGNFGTLSPEAYRWYPASQSGKLISVQVKARQTTNGYELEARIPWVIFGITPSAGARYGLALSVSDDDLAGSAVQQSMVSNVGTRLLLDPTSWGTLILGAP